MASLITVRLNKGDAPSLGFRLQGGQDFGTPLVIQKVNGGSPAERAGLIAGDSVIKINSTDVFNLRHKDAQDVIVRAGPAFEVTIQRGGSTWKPTVIPTGSIPTPAPSVQRISPVTKTSLASSRNDNIGAIGTGHNLAAKPFSPQQNGTVNGGPRLVNNQYNTPLKLYSDQSIAETLSAQTEVLSTGALGVNFKKNEKNYDATNSAVYRMLQEAEKEPRTPEEEPDSGVVTCPLGVAGLRRVQAPENRPAPANPQLPPGQNICADCERLIVGVFVRIKDKNLHVECFKCATCGTSLKNVGYYNINNKLYCDVHAKLAARNNPPAANLVPVTVPPGGRVPASAISAALSSHSLPSPSPLSPKTNNLQPFQPPPLQPIQLDNNVNKGADFLSSPMQSLNITNDNEFNNNNKVRQDTTPVSFQKYLKGGNYTSAPKPFSSVAPPSYNTLPKAAPLSPISSAPAPTFSPASSVEQGSVHSIVWPPPSEEPEAPATACPLYFPPPSQVQIRPIRREAAPDEFDDEIDEINQQMDFRPKMSICSEEVAGITLKTAMECVETISESLQTHQLVESVLKKNRPPSPPPLGQEIIIPPIQKSRSACPSTSTDFTFSSKDSPELKRLVDFNPNTIECQLPSLVQNSVPREWESQMVQALKTVPDAFSQIPSTKHSSSAFASALNIAPSEPFTPQPYSLLTSVPLPEETEPYFPPEHPMLIEPKEPKPDKPDSEFVKALKIAPERPFTPTSSSSSTTGPVRKKKEPMDEFFKDLPKPDKLLSMRDALTTASDRPYTPIISESVGVVVEKPKKENPPGLEKPLKPKTLPSSFKPQPYVASNPIPPSYPLPTVEKNISLSSESITSEMSKKSSSESHQQQTNVVEEIVEEDMKPQGFLPLFTGFNCSFENKTDKSQFKIEICTTPPVPERTTPNVKITRSEDVRKSEQVTAESSTKKKIEKQSESVVLKKPLQLAQALHKAEGLPQYQVNISDNAEADLKLMKKVEEATARHEMQKINQPINPVITIQPGDTIQSPPRSQEVFKPVMDENRPQNTTFSPRPRPLTPSMINKPPPAIPYYQSSLVHQHYGAPSVNLLDPSSPAISRSPSPCLGEGRSSSPFPTRSSSALRAKSPAEGPPPNPLRRDLPPPTRQDFRVEQAKKSLTNYIPHYKEQMALIEKAQSIQKQQDQQQQMWSGHVQQLTGSRLVEDSSKCQKSLQETSQGVVATRVSEQSHLDHLEAQRKSQSQVLEKSDDGLVQIQRTRRVTEEFERTQKASSIEIEKNVISSSTHHPFKDVNVSSIDEQNIVGLHVTNPHAITSPFIKADLKGELKNVSTAPPVCGGGGVCQKSCSQVQKVCDRKDSIPSQPTPPQVTKHVFAPSQSSPVKHVPTPSSGSSTSKSNEKPNQCTKTPSIPGPNLGAGGGRQAGGVRVAPTRGRGVLNTAAIGGSRVPLCGQCHMQIRGPFITALGKIWCPDHFICSTPSCRRPLQDLGFVEERGQLYCEYCFEQYLAPPCSKCGSKIKGDCLKAIGKNFHPECFNCIYCGKLFANSPFFLEDGNPYCENDWNELFTTKCFACGFPVEAGDRWVEALNNNYHSQCFNCTMCKKNLEGQSFFAKGGRPFCKNHAR